MQDFTGGHVQVQISRDGKVVWVNLNGGCILRISRAESVKIEDCRPRF